MIKQVSHTVTGAGPADLALALGVAYELHPPVTRAPEIATTSTGARPTAARRRRTVRG
ncbi:hypothetical protein [Streptomyces sp. A012304]|uniref:hypothetical protein n=1 Tax=Streptomyces sp. A012304 TaxID=375446 RepID=UPI00222E93DA|nr:hypothetical protein [Streptomyces sp. A012304]GKQ36965.1 hypothetical protein ALMP_35040 [Streptomyces sp. A012304]